MKFLTEEEIVLLQDWFTKTGYSYRELAGFLNRNSCQGIFRAVKVGKVKRETLDAIVRGAEKDIERRKELLKIIKKI